MNAAVASSSALAAPFVEGLARQELRFQRCTACGTAQTLARHACAHCGADTLQWETARGTATLHALTVVSRAPSDAFRALAPYTLVIAQLDEGPRLMAHAEPGLHIGERVRAGFFAHEGRTLVRFAREPG
ncbi:MULTISPECIES: OB-fold domain-containing protein [unclassified Variovorax]|uniref:Zn-ribbon domain-containing OB-fold protein n=1 Tax=unclassified Variovorax TaxID=663243 RepID=UPI002576EB7C|nr:MULTISPECIES: OB-fold domain-containing protein [unclassified Variovorax]MDM0086932.1 OB-fold domain-containing protein [Variovorax sp. J22G40]MDM0144811.1 OB-fold domain-containing protein [Variovorax sp. J2P1-31]